MLLLVCIESNFIHKSIIYLFCMHAFHRFYVATHNSHSKDIHIQRMSVRQNERKSTHSCAIMDSSTNPSNYYNHKEDSKV